MMTTIIMIFGTFLLEEVLSFGNINLSFMIKTWLLLMIIPDQLKATALILTPVPVKALPYCVSFRTLIYV
jgi:hypothetical protein